VNHQDDLYYLFAGGPRFNQPLKTESDFKVRKFFVSAWTNFAKYGNPNIKSLPCNCIWERATADNFRHLSIKAFPEMKDHTLKISGQSYQLCKAKIVQR
ncbi:Bile salt-activated lipase, partial [Armadillidium vulgare]